MRILIAEDDFTSRNMLAAVLKKAGHEVTETSDGAGAWDEMKKPNAPPLAILDWMMPGMSGLEVVRRVRALETDKPPYLIMLTTKGEKGDVISGLDAGADDYLSKPFDAGELQARIEVGRRMVEMQDKLVKSNEALAYQANHDTLTGLPNRGAILDRLQDELARAKRHCDVLSVGMCDIDHFKAVNDTYGHQTGDEVLCELARLLTECCREYDAVGRIGGEEFLLIVPMKPNTGVVPQFDRICSSVAETKIVTRSGALSITLSIGAAIAADGDTADNLLGAADAALYRAKKDGRNRVVMANRD